jgi:hypothetical protein
MIAIGAGRASKLLSCLKSGMPQVNEIKPTVVASTDERFAFSKSKGGERASIICNPNANDHLVLVDQPMGGYNYCGDRSHMYHFLRLTSSEMRSVLFDPTYEFALGVNCPTVASQSDPGSHTARLWEICTRNPRINLNQ